MLSFLRRESIDVIKLFDYLVEIYAIEVMGTSRRPLRSKRKRLPPLQRRTNSGRVHEKTARSIGKDPNYAKVHAMAREQHIRHEVRREEIVRYQSSLTQWNQEARSLHKKGHRSAGTRSRWHPILWKPVQQNRQQRRGVQNESASTGRSDSITEEPTPIKDEICSTTSSNLGGMM